MAHTSFYDKLRALPDHQQQVPILKTYSNLERKTTSLIVRRNFLVDCRRENLTPSHISYAFHSLTNHLNINSPYRNQIGKMMDEFKSRVLSLEIKVTCWQLRTMEMHKRTNKQEITAACNQATQSTFFHTQNIRRDKLKSRCKQTTMRKLRKLQQRQAQSSHLSDNTNWVENLSDVQIPIEVQRAISYGSKFSLDPKIGEIPIFRIIADCEDLIRDVDPPIADDARQEMINVLTNYLNKSKYKKLCPAQKRLRMDFEATTTFLKTHNELLIMNADKGGKTVVMTREHYRSMMATLLSTTDTYVQVGKDLTSRHQRINNAFVKKLADNQMISGEEKQRLTTYNYIRHCPQECMLYPRCTSWRRVKIHDQ